MIKAIITDLSKVLLFPADKNYSGKLNDLHEKLLKSEDYNFWEYFQINEELLNLYKKLSEKINIYIFTTGYIQEYPPLKQKLEKIFKKIFSAHRLGLEKSESSTYFKLAEMIDEEPDNILYIDDKIPNLEAAEKAGLTTYHYTENDNFIKYLNG